MVSNYTANYITIINNSIINNRSYCKIPYSRLGEKITSLLFKSGYIIYYRLYTLSNKEYIYIYLKTRTMIHSIFKLKLISKPTNNVYWTCNRLWNETFTSNIITNYVLSTSKGIILNSLALTYSVGGKILFQLN